MANVTMLNKATLNLLVEHIDGPIKMMLSSGAIYSETFNHLRRMAIRSAVAHGFLRYVEKGSPTKTELTVKGREAMCADLAAIAEILLRAKFTPEFRPPMGLPLPSVSPDS